MWFQSGPIFNLTIPYGSPIVIPVVEAKRPRVESHEANWLRAWCCTGPQMFLLGLVDLRSWSICQFAWNSFVNTTYRTTICGTWPCAYSRASTPSKVMPYAWDDHISWFCTAACAICIRCFSEFNHWLILMATIISICVHQFHNLCSLCMSLHVNACVTTVSTCRIEEHVESCPTRLPLIEPCMICCKISAGALFAHLSSCAPCWAKSKNHIELILGTLPSYKSPGPNYLIQPNSESNPPYKADKYQCSRWPKHLFQTFGPFPNIHMSVRASVSATKMGPRVRCEP